MMGSRHPPKIDLARTGLGALLRAQHDGLLEEELPDTWIALMNCVDEIERTRLKCALAASPGEPEADD